MKLRSALLAATVLVAPVAAKAQAISGLYIGAGVGANIMQDQTLSSVRFPATGVNVTGSGSPVRMDTGIIGLGSIGFGFGNGFRAELEGSYRQNKFTSIGSGATRFNGGGDEMKYSGMVNVLYDIDPTVFGFLPVPLNPYVGVGGGASYAQHRNSRFTNIQSGFAGFPGGFRTLLRSNDADVAPAVQGIIGTAIPITSVPGLSLTVEYRFMALIDDRSYHYQFFQGAATPTRANVKFSDDYNHSILVGFRYAFNAAPLPVVVQPPVVVQGVQTTYLVFFDWDRADLTDRARQIIAEAARATTRTQVTRIELTGNTDTTGTARYNQGLSVRRAQNVAAELVRLGVPRAAITTRGVGFSNLLVATGPNVREPQNRRVEIVLR